MFRQIVLFALTVGVIESFLLPSGTFFRYNSLIRSTSGDTVTGVKFEEEDEKKNPLRRGGHVVKGMPEVDPETAARQEAIRAHQDSCKRLSWPEEIRTLMKQPLGFATLSTIANSGETSGFPLGSIVGFAVDETGAPIFCFSGMSAHTKNLQHDNRASLCVTEPSFQGAADARTTLVGTIKMLKGDTEAAARVSYMESHPNAYWAQFGDFKMYRMEDILEISFVGGFARAGSITWEEYAAADVDPCAAFAAPVMAHMNGDHSESLKQYLEWIVGAAPAAEFESAEMKSLDRFGFNVRATQKGGGSGVLRVPFVGGAEVTERSQIKKAIIDLSQQCSEKQKAAEAEAAST